MENIIAKRYAEAFFSKAETDEDRLEDCLSDLDVFCKIFEQKKELYDILTHPLIRPERKVDLLKKIMANADIYVTNLLCLLANNSRMDILGDVATEVKRFYRHKNGIRGLVVKSAVPLKDEERKQLSVVLEKKFGDVSVREVVDKSIGGGLIIHFGNKVIDNSIRTRIKRMKEIMHRIDEAWLKEIAEQPSMAL